ncbi:MAG: methionine gamma-lyase family protein [Clostridiales bacterium]|nr:methionine gamma-lyase family protein [Clostridiales bacterium]
MNNEELNILASRAEAELAPIFAEIDENSYRRTADVLAAFEKHRVSDACFAASSGYGYDDRGREVLDRVYADVFGTEAALVRINFVNGTHALSTGLFALLRPGDTLFSVAGKPYDTLEEVIGISGEKNNNGSLADFGVKYAQHELMDGRLDTDAILARLDSDPSVKVVFIQRSKGYLNRRTLTPGEISTFYRAVKKNHPDVWVVVDNCYGEFTCEREPEADMLIGSLIKNPGGGMAETGGYIAGTARAVELASYRLTTVGTGGEVGCTMGQNKNLFRGFFYAPHTVAAALKTMHLAAYIFEALGYDTSPAWNERRADIIQTVITHSPDALCAFCRGIQSGSPVDSFVAPVPWAMPGYSDEVIMAAGAFVQGSSIELSCDGPLREPYTVYLQGGLTYESGKYGILKAAAAVGKREKQTEK